MATPTENVIAAIGAQITELKAGIDTQGRGFAPRFLQTPPRDDALALR